MINLAVVLAGPCTVRFFLFKQIYQTVYTLSLSTSCKKWCSLCTFMCSTTLVWNTQCLLQTLFSSYVHVKITQQTGVIMFWEVSLLSIY